MIFVISGSQKFQLNRLFSELDHLLECGKIQDEVFAQIGSSDYVPKHYRYERFLSHKHFENIIAQSDLIIAHSGVGSIVSALEKGKRVIVYPRLAKYHEVVDDHQVEIAASFEEKNWVLVCRENDDLAKIIERCKTHRFSRYERQGEELVSAVEAFLTSI